jgi:hypothetical protein
MGGRHGDVHQFNILIDKPYHYGGHKMRTTVLNELAEHFRGYSIDLRVQLEFWEKIESCEMYGLIKPYLPLGGIDNLRELIARCEWLEQNDRGRMDALPDVERTRP